jgi:hypothetical protein
MKTFMLLLVGFIGGGVVGGLVGTGVGAGAGIVTGMQAGACLAIEAAKDKGLISAEQVDQIFAAAAESLKTQADQIKTDQAADAVIADSDAECQAVVAELKRAAAN